MTHGGGVVEASWTIGVLSICSVALVLGVNALLLHATQRKANGRLVRPFLRIVTGRPRARSLSASMPSTTAKISSCASNRGSDGASHVWETARLYVAWEQNDETRKQVQRWIDTRDIDAATRGLMGKRLAFGTSGLRGAMGPGFCRINDLVVIQTTQGLCRYLEIQGGEEFKKRGVVIGRDHRQQDGLSSEGFAHLTAAVFVSRGFRVLLMGGTVATPLVAFGVSHTNACAGVMMTASHNPKKDNGYKVYWGNGSQIIPPHDKGIAASIQENLEPWQVYDPESAIAGPLCSDPTEQIAEAYYRGIRDGLCRRPQANARTGLKVVYSAMHGVADAWAWRAFSCFSLPAFVTVGCQQHPDPEFPTVAFPNPEEQGALKEAMLLAEERGVSLVLANDPDGDRLAAAERQPSGEWHVFSGNDIGTLLGVWQWEEWRRTHPDEAPGNAVVIASTVSSNMLSAVARYEGFTFEETLPGFKWMGHRGQQLKAQGKTILFAYEEAIGFGPGDVVFEKDGLSSAALFAEMRVALHDRAQDQGHPPGSSTSTSSPTPSASSLSSLACSGTPSIAGRAPSKWTKSGVAAAVKAAATAPSSMFLTRGSSRSSSSGGTGNKDKSAGASPHSPPSSPSTVGASPPLSPSADGHLRDSTEPLDSSAAVFPSCAARVATTADVEAVAVGVAREGERRGRSSVLLRRLKALHERYGEFAEENGYVRCEDTEVVSKIFDRLRGDGSYRSSFGRYMVTAVRDLADGHGYDSETADKRPTLPVGAGGTHFLTFKLGEEGVVATLRTSGTEPKIKFYMEMQGEPGVPLEEVSARLSKVAEVFLDEALQLRRWGMERVALA